MLMGNGCRCRGTLTNPGVAAATATAASGFEIDMRRPRGVPVRLPTVFLFDFSFLAVTGLEIGMRCIRVVTDVSVCLRTVFLFDFSFLAVPGLEIDTRRIRGVSVTDVSVCFSAVFLFEFSSLGRVTSDRVVCGG